MKRLGCWSNSRALDAWSALPEPASGWSAELLTFLPIALLPGEFAFRASITEHGSGQNGTDKRDALVRPRRIAPKSRFAGKPGGKVLAGGDGSALQSDKSG